MKDGEMGEQAVNGGYDDVGDGREWNRGSHDAVNQVETIQQCSGTVKAGVEVGKAVNVVSHDTEDLEVEELETILAKWEVGGTRGVKGCNNIEVHVGRGHGYKEDAGGENDGIGDASDDGNDRDIDGDIGSDGKNKAMSVPKNSSWVNVESIGTKAVNGGPG
ncbi:hypothetical protein AHAS_Ahas06G0017300 [Arachis hypogaea]